MTTVDTKATFLGLITISFVKLTPSEAAGLFLFVIVINTVAYLIGVWVLAMLVLSIAAGAATVWVLFWAILITLILLRMTFGSKN